MERRKGSNRAKVTRPWWRHGHPVHSCAWCDLPGQGAGHLPCRVSRQVPRCHVATGDAVGTAAASPAPRPASALRRLLVLIPSAGREESSGGKSLKTRVDMTSNVKSWLPIFSRFHRI